MSAIDVFLALTEDKPNTKINLEQYIATWKITADDNKYVHKRASILKFVEFLEFMLYKQDCKSLADVYSSIEKSQVPMGTMTFFVEENYVPFTFRDVVKNGYSQIKFPKPI